MIFLNTNNTNLLPEDNENVKEMKIRKFQNLYYGKPHCNVTTNVLSVPSLFFMLIQFYLSF